MSGLPSAPRIASTILSLLMRCVQAKSSRPSALHTCGIRYPHQNEQQYLYCAAGLHRQPREVVLLLRITDVCQIHARYVDQPICLQNLVIQPSSPSVSSLYAEQTIQTHICNRTEAKLGIKPIHDAFLHCFLVDPKRSEVRY